mmetsp:Transcript_10068/g.12332  ORF Transcript_10068/g.12332 Transcript_10068/m.12332 type:complete len:87 (+) Transcript_10068:642-902(+)
MFCPNNQTTKNFGRFLSLYPNYNHKFHHLIYSYRSLPTIKDAIHTKSTMFSRALLNFWGPSRPPPSALPIPNEGGRSNAGGQSRIP